MPDASPSPQQLPGSRIDYAPIAPTAVAAVVCAVLFVALLIVIALMAILSGKTLQEPWLLIFPVLTVVLAFVARRQIRASEGTQTGEYWANLGWTIAIVGGALLVAYLMAIQYAVRREAKAAFYAFSEPFVRSDPANPLDPGLATATYYTLKPGQQALVLAPTNAAGIQTGQREALDRLRASDLGHLIARNKGEVTITAGTLVGWSQTGQRIDSVMAGTVESPEGTALIALPVVGESQEGQPRRWYVGSPPPAGYFAASPRKLTPYGWAIELLGQSATNAMQQLLTLQGQGQIELVYEAFIKPDGDPQAVAERAARRATTALPRAALLGNVAGVPTPPVEMPAAIDALFAGVTGTLLAGEQLDRFRTLFFTPGRIVPAATRYKENPDTLPLVLVGPGAVTATVPLEVALSEGAQSAIAVGKAQLTLPPASAAALMAELAALKSPRGEATTTPPVGLYERLGGNIRWKLVRLESDLQPVAAAQPKQAPGGMGGL